MYNLYYRFPKDGITWEGGGFEKAMQGHDGILEEELLTLRR